ncbi:alpha-xenorhabdolysin family binary toxin subunit A [Pseudomonas amygdali]|uniref:alpha-xenorhabdolysin family binary toxin subunit A n=1 Tax=Pseudomonas amygdali TaxID=47877 RepID=UPI001C55B00A|nr:alpha-xenorhabdolysin family binary toxin subunit A [Pseudomonas amygdali]QXW44274.1 alpha-xenorhabdolysin family binary toxin subunit A [Pseudomonas amygdali]
MNPMFYDVMQAEPLSADPKADEAIKTAELFGTMSSANDKHVTRAPGLILTKEQIINLKKYELAGLALPVELEDVIVYLGYSKGAGAGLEPEDFLKSFNLIHRHARRWSPLRTDLLGIGSKLKVFAGKMLVYGQSMEEINGDVRAGKIVDHHQIKTLEDVTRLSLELGKDFPGIELDENDKEITQEIGSHLTDILDLIAANLADAQTIKKELDQFGLDLSLHVGPEIQRKMVAIDNSSLPADVAKLNLDIEQRAKDIDEKNKEYKAVVQQSLNSVSSLNIVGLALGIYFGVEAENVRAARNELMTQQTADIDTLQDKNTILGSLSRVKFNLQNLATIVVDADVATKNLITVWNKLFLFIEASAVSASEINDALSLRQFMNHFRQVVHPWKTIEVDSDALLNVFKEADEEYKRIYG